jgi:hypothetical protein
MSCMLVCAYVSCRCNSSCFAVLRFVVYVDIYFASVMATRSRPLVCGCCKSEDFTGFDL